MTVLSDRLDGAGVLPLLVLRMVRVAAVVLTMGMAGFSKVFEEVVNSVRLNANQKSQKKK